MNDPTVLRWYVTVAEMLAFGRAAKELNISRQRLSAAVRELQDEVGEPLFVPGDGPTTLTAAGETLLVHARDVVAEDDRRRAEEDAARPAVPTLMVGFVPGVTVTKWTRIWADRFPTAALDTVVVDESEQVAAIRDGRVDMCFVREPSDTDGLHAVPLYSEVSVIVVPKDHPAAAYESLQLADLDGETLQDLDSSVETTLEMVAAGVGPVLLPHSLARLHSRKDLVYRPVTDADPTRILLAWPVGAEASTADGLDLQQEFLGIVRGRAAHSSRTEVERSPAKKAAVKKAGVQKAGVKKSPAPKKAPARKRSRR